MSERVDKAARTFAEGCNCCQSVLWAVGEELGLDRETALKLGQGMGGGMGHLGQTCGAVTGAFMAIGLVHARLEKGQEAAKERAYELVAECGRRFKARHGHLDCPSLLGFDLADPQALAQARQAGIFRTRCAGFVRDAVEIVEELLELDQHGAKP